MKSRPRMMSAVARIFDLSIGEMLWSRRTLFLVLLAGVPIACGLALRLVGHVGAVAVHVDNSPLTGPAIFGTVIWVMYVRFIVPLLGVFYGTALIADEVENRTITYLLTRPIPRSAILLGKYCAFVVLTTLIVLPSVLVLYFLIVPVGGGSIGGMFPALVQDVGLLALGLAAYGALFAWIGAALNRPLLVGLMFVFGWEQAALLLPGYLKKLTVAYYLQALVPHAMPSDDALDVLRGFARDQPPPMAAVAWLVLIGVVCLWFGARTIERREYNS